MPGLAAAPAPAERPALTLLWWGDCAGQLGDGQAPEGSGDLRRLATLLAQERLAAGATPPLVLAGGGLLSGSLSANLSQGALPAQALAALAPTAWVPGMPDLAWGVPRLRALQTGLPPTLVANLRLPAPALGSGSLVLEQAGWRVGLIGLAEEDLLAPGREWATEAAASALARELAKPRQTAPDLWVLAWRAPLQRGEPTAAHRALLARFPQIHLLLLSGPGAGHPGQRLGETWVVQAPGGAAGLAKVRLTAPPTGGRPGIESRLLSAVDCLPEARLSQATAAALAEVAEQAEQRAGFLPLAVGGPNGQRPVDFMAGVLADRLGTRALLLPTPLRWRWVGAKPLKVGDLHLALPDERPTGRAWLTPTELSTMLHAQAQATGFNPADLLGGLHWQPPPSPSAAGQVLAHDGTALPPHERLPVALVAPGCGAGEVPLWRTLTALPAARWQPSDQSLRAQLAAWLRERRPPE